MPKTALKIWNTYLNDPRNYAKIAYHYTARPEIELVHDIRDHVALSDGDVPEYIFFNLRDLKKSYKENLPDYFHIRGGIPFVSERFKDLLTAHDMDPTQFIEVPLREYDQKTPRPGRWFLLNILAQKPTLVPERSEKLTRVPTPDGTYWTTGMVLDDVLAARADSAEGADLWFDPNLRNRFFLTDRLKCAIKDQKMRIRSMPMRPCIVVG